MTDTTTLVPSDRLPCLGEPRTSPGTPQVTVVAVHLPDLARRVWRDERSGALLVRDLGGLGPKGAVPVGYVAPGVVIPSPDMREVEVEHVARYFATTPDAHAGQPATWPTDAPYAPGGNCIRCRVPGGLPHAADCRHSGKEVGDKVN